MKASLSSTGIKHVKRISKIPLATHIGSIRNDLRFIIDNDLNAPQHEEISTPQSKESSSFFFLFIFISVLFILNKILNLLCQIRPGSLNFITGCVTVTTRMWRDVGCGELYHH